MIALSKLCGNVRGKWMLRLMRLMIYLRWDNYYNNPVCDQKCYLRHRTYRWFSHSVAHRLYKIWWIASRREVCILWWGKFSYYFLFIITPAAWWRQLLLNCLLSILVPLHGIGRERKQNWRKQWKITLKAFSFKVVIFALESFNVVYET